MVSAARILWRKASTSGGKVPSFPFSRSVFNNGRGEISTYSIWRPSTAPILLSSIATLIKKKIQRKKFKVKHKNKKENQSQKQNYLDKEKRSVCCIGSIGSNQHGWCLCCKSLFEGNQRAQQPWSPLPLCCVCEWIMWQCWSND